MRELGLDGVTELLVTLAATVGAVAFTAVGVLVDRAGLHNVLEGAIVPGVWELWMGSVAIFVGLYLLGYRTAWPALAGRR